MTTEINDKQQHNHKSEDSHLHIIGLRSGLVRHRGPVVIEDRAEIPRSSGMIDNNTGLAVEVRGIAVPVDATPNVVAIPIAAVGPIVATATPSALNVALVPEPPAAAFASTSAFLISLCFILKFSISNSIFFSVTLNSFGVLAN